MVEGVVRVGTEGETQVLPQRYLPHEAEIPHVLTRPIERCARRIAQGVLGRGHKSRGIEPLLHRTRRACNIWIPYLGYVLPPGEDPERVSLRDEVRVSLLKLGYRTDLPVSDHLRDHRNVGEKSAARSEGQGVH